LRNIEGHLNEETKVPEPASFDKVASDAIKAMPN